MPIKKAKSFRSKIREDKAREAKGAECTLVHEHLETEQQRSIRVFYEESFETELV